MKRPTIVCTFAVGALIQGAIWSLTPCDAAFAVTPPNDNFDAATDITASGTTGSVSGTNVGASLEPGEPDTVPTGSGNSVWYRWTAPTTTCVVFDIESSAITHAVVSAFTGSSVNALTEVPRANHTGIDVDRLVFQATVGTAYSVRVDGYSDAVSATGDFVLHWTVPGTGPPNDNFANAESIGNGLMGSATGTNVDATPECGEPEIKNDGTIYANSGRSVWYQWTAPANVRIVFTTDGSSFDTLLAVYQGGAVNALTLVVSNDDLPDSVYSPSFVAFDAGAMQQYAIAVDGYDLASGGTVLNWTPAPANDDFANATDITPYGATGMIVGDNLGGTSELGEPRHSGCDPGRSLWYRWTAPAGGLTTFDTSGSLTNETAAVYIGSSITGLTPVLAVDGGQRAAFVTFTAAAGTSYRIAVTGRCDGLVAGSFVLNWAPGSMATQTATSTATQIPTATATSSATPTPSRTSTVTRTNTPTLAPTPTPSLTQTVTRTATPSTSPTTTATRTPASTEPPTHTVTASPTSIPTRTPTPSTTATSTPTATRTATTTSPPTPTNTPTRTTATATPTANSTPTPSNARTATPSSTSTATSAPTATATVTHAATGTPMSTETSTITPTHSPTATAMWTRTSTLTSSPTAPPTSAATDTPAKPTPTTQVLTETPTLVPIATRTPTGTVTFTPSAIPTAVPTPAVTRSSTRTAAPTATSTATSTLASTATGTATRTVGVPPTSPPTPVPCVGDCDAVGTVAINNIITLVNIALGTAESSMCPHGVPSGTDVNVAVIIQAVNSALNGCGGNHVAADSGGAAVFREVQASRAAPAQLEFQQRRR